MKASFTTSRVPTKQGPLLIYDSPSAVTLRDLIELSRDVPADRPYLIEGERTLTFGELIPAVGGLARHFREIDSMRPGDRVGIASANCIEWALTAWAATCSNAIAVGLNSWWHPEEAVEALTLTTPRILVLDKHYFTLLEEHLAKLPFIEATYIIGDVPATSVNVQSLPAGLVAELPAPEAIDPDSVATLLFTSGTTGLAKAVSGTHRNACTTFQNTQWMATEYFPQISLHPLDAVDHPCTLLTAPMFHVAGLQWGFMFPAATGTTVVINTGRYRAEKALALAVAAKATSLGGVPTTLMRILDLPNFSEHDLSNISNVSWGGAPAPADLAQRCVDSFPHLALVGTGYGLTETCGLGVYAAGTDLLANPTTAGRAMPCVEVRVVTTEGDASGPGNEGEVQIRGPIVMAGYWNNPEATTEVLSDDGWFSTGDLGYLSPDGFLFLTGRKKEIIIRGGENVYPVEIENVLRMMPGVIDAGVAGRSHRELGEEVVAYVQIEPGTRITEQTLKDHVRAHLAGFKVPTSIDIGESVVPRNAAGKIIRDAIAGRSLRFTQVL